MTVPPVADDALARLNAMTGPEASALLAEVCAGLDIALEVVVAPAGVEDVVAPDAAGVAEEVAQGHLAPRRGQPREAARDGVVQ